MSIKSFFVKNSKFQLPLVAITLVFVDQCLKFLSSFVHVKSFLGLTIERVLNDAFIFGIKSNNIFMLESFITIFIFSSFIMIYIALIYFLPEEFSKTKWGLTFLFAGAFSNIIDRIMFNQVVDFLRIKFITGIYYINFADFIQTVGWVFIFYELFKKRHIVWRNFEKRKTLLVLKKHQYEFIIYVLWMVLFTFLLTTLVGLDFLNRMSEASVTQQSDISSNFPFYAFYLFVIFLIPILFITIYFSNKIYGPIYAFERYVKSLLEGKVPSHKLNLREKDQFKHLEKLAEEIKNKLQK